MYSRKRIRTIRETKCAMFKGLIERPRLIYGRSCSQFINTRVTHSSSNLPFSLELPFSSKDDFELRKHSICIEWNEDEKQFKIVPEKKV